MIQGKLIPRHDNLAEVLRIWQEVFIDEGIIPAEMIQGATVDNTIHALVYEGVDVSCPVAAGRLSMEKDSAKIELVAVLQKFRGKEYGDFVVRMLLDKAVNSGAKNITVIAPEPLTGFFQKQGFVDSGDITDWNGTKCIVMKFNHSIIKKCCKEPKNV